MASIRDSEHLCIPFQDIEIATKNFTTLIGEGGFGKVYKGELSVGSKLAIVAVKRLNVTSLQGSKEFLTEVHLLSRYKHPNLVSLLGFCEEDNEKILVYEHAAHGSFDKFICMNPSSLTCMQKINICIDVASGLDYLHNRVAEKHRVIHRDIKSSNILLDHNLKGMISDLGLSKVGRANEKDTFLVTDACGTLGYCDPVYIQTGVLTKESDVYSFGVILFEVLCGKLCFIEVDEKRGYLAHYAKDYYKEDKLHEIIDPFVAEQLHPGSLKEISYIAYQCLHSDREKRPSMDLVVKRLKQALEAPDKYVHNNSDEYNQSVSKSASVPVKAFSYTEMVSRMKEEERNEKAIRNLLRLPENRRCINCNSLGPQYVCTSFWTFICVPCAGIHRELTHMVKSASMSKFTRQEVNALQGGGNASAKEIYFKEWDAQRQSFPDYSCDVERLRDFIKHVYVDRRYTGERSFDKPPRAKMRTASSSSLASSNGNPTERRTETSLIDFVADPEPPSTAPGPPPAPVSANDNWASSNLLDVLSELSVPASGNNPEAASVQMPPAPAVTQPPAFNAFGSSGDGGHLQNVLGQQSFAPATGVQPPTSSFNQDLFSSSYAPYTSQGPGWYPAPQYGMGYNMQYNLPQPPMPPVFAQPSKSSNPFDLNESPSVQATTFPSMAPLQSALPNTGPPSGMQQPLGLGAAAPTWMTNQPMPPPGPSYGSSMPSGPFMGQIPPNTPPQPSPQVGNYGYDMTSFGSLSNTNQQQSGLYATPNTSSNPFG